MKNAPQILIAKYSADLLRMEPRNAGVIIWTPERIIAKFLGEQNDNKVRAPRMVPKEDRHAYKEWISYWRLMIARDEIKADNGQRVPRTSPAFIQALQAKSKSSFALVDAGFMRGRIQAHELPAIADECFDILVKEPDVDRIRQHKIALRKAAGETFEMAGVRDYGELKKPFPVSIKFGRLTKDLPFDYAVVQGDVPLALFQRVSVPQNASICSASFMFDKLHRNAKKKTHKSAKRCAIILSDDSESDNEAAENLSVLKLYVDEVVDVADVGEAAKNVRRLVA